MIDWCLWTTVTIAFYLAIRHSLGKRRVTLLNPILVTILSIILVLILTKVDYETYKVSTDWITFLLGPVVVMLAIPLYKNRYALMQNFKAILAGIVTSILTSLASVVGMGKLLDLNSEIIRSMMPKSITTPMALEVTKLLGANEGFTVVFVIITGVIGATLAPITLKVFMVKNDLAKGIGIGAAAHGIGTSKAVDLGEEVAASSGLAMGIAGVTTVLFYSLLAGVL